MVLSEFKNSLLWDNPPKGINSLLKALWFSVKGNWHQAHRIVLKERSNDAYWIQGYLYRVQGDIRNASYWYSNARKDVPNIPLEKEWENIVNYLLSNQNIN